jgi:peptide chain release factor 1
MAITLTVTDERVLAKLGKMNQRFEELESQMNDPATSGFSAQFVQIAKEHGNLKEMVNLYRLYLELRHQYQDTETLLGEGTVDPEMQELAAEELKNLNDKSQKALNRAKEKLVMSQDATIGSIIVEVRAGTGGDEASLFARDLYGMYTRYAEKRGWKMEQMDFSTTEKGGFREIIFSVKGEGVWQALGYEGGGHRVQRVPETEAQGRIHTSAATVAVLPEPEELEIDIKKDEVIEHVCRASGPGGQNVNKVSSAIKLEHIPTGITVSMQDEKSQHKNRAKAWRILRSRVYDLYEQQKRAERSETRKTMIGSGDRSQRIRTYNFPQNRLTDHRINLSLYSLDKIIMGEMDELVNALIEYDKQQRLESL